jgi:hypothetical protein
MNTYNITIWALALIGTGFSILLTLKYITLKTYFKRQVSKNNDLLDSNVEQQERINVLSKQLEKYKNSDQEKTIQKLHSELSEKTAKILRKNKLIQSQVDQLTSLENEHNDLITTHSMASEKIAKFEESTKDWNLLVDSKEMKIELFSKEVTKLNNIQKYLQDRLKNNEEFQQVIRDLEGGKEELCTKN